MNKATLGGLMLAIGGIPDRLSAAGFAEYHPVASNFTAEGRGMNRRVDIVVLGHSLTSASLAQPGTQSQAPAARPADKTAQPSAAATPTPTVVRAADRHLQQ